MESIHARKRLAYLDYFGVQQPEISGARLNIYRRTEINKFIKIFRCHALKNRLILFWKPSCVDDFSSIHPSFQHFYNNFWWMLHISIHRNSAIPTTIIKSNFKSNLMPKIS